MFFSPRRTAGAFQSPSLRGSGRFAPCRSRPAGDRAFQSPSLRGSGRFERARRDAERRARVSIPFIAGQWSLRAERNRPDHGRRHGFNPLHCGAVVASLCGGSRGASRRRVSIPFIAGQWSLRHSTGVDQSRGGGFQSPSLRGSGRFTRRRPRTPRTAPDVSIPFIAGQWSLLAGLERALRRG